MARTRWWGERALAVGERGRWRIGPLTLWVERHPHEWVVSHVQGADHLDDSVELAVPCGDGDAPPDGAEGSRYAVRETRDAIAIQPRLADRAVVARTSTPLHVLAGEEVTLYVSTPMWVELRSGGEMTDVPTFRPSDTWFGNDTMKGDLCYASRTAAELDLEDLVVRPARAITTVTLRNTASDPAYIERINLPVHHLSLFADDALAFWTERVTVIRDEDGETSTRLDAGPPPDAAKAERVSDPRRDRDRSKMIRAFSALLG